MTNKNMHEDSTKARALRDQVSAEMHTNNLSQSQVASQSSIGKARLNQWLKDSYTGNNQEIEDQLNVWLNSRKKRAESIGNLPQAPRWVETVTGQRILTALSYAQIATDICCIYGGAGVGKTSSSRYYSEQNSNVWIATMTPATSGVAASLERIAIELGLKNYPGRASRLELVIVERLQNTNGLLIIDEAQHLSKPALEAIRSLHDQSEIGIALVGNEMVFSQLTGGGVRAEGFAQIFSRIGKRVRLIRPEKGDVIPIAKAWDITDKVVIQELIKIASKPGALRGLTKALRLGSMIAIGKNVTLGISEVREACRDLGIS